MLKDGKDVLLNVRDLVIEFRNKGKKFQAVKGANFDIYNKEIFGLVGESGSGKTTIGRAIAGVQPLADGAIYLDNQLIAGAPTSLYKINKDIYRKIKFVQSKYDANCDYITDLILDLQKNFNYYKSQPTLLIDAKWKKVFSTLNVDLVHKLTEDNLKFMNEIIKSFRRINQFIYGIHQYIPEISTELEQAVFTKNLDTLDIIIRLKDKMSLDFHDLDDIKNQINKIRLDRRLTLQKLKDEKEEVIKTFNEHIKKARQAFKANAISQNELSLEEKTISKSKEDGILNYEKNREIATAKQFDVFLDLVHFTFTKLKLIKQNDDKIQRRIKIALNLEEQNLDLSSPQKMREDLLRKYQSRLEHANQELTERQINSIHQLLGYLKLQSIDELVSSSYLFSKPSKNQKRQNRKNVQMIFQDPGSSLNERMSVEEVISEGLDNFPELFKSIEAKEEYVSNYNQVNPKTPINIEGITKTSDVKKYIILKLLKSVGLMPEHLSRYPHEFSGGQKQRIGIARSLALKPKIIIADEPISALDVSIRAQVLNLFQEFKEEYNLTYLFVTHDLSVVKFIADRIAVIYHGDIVELASADDLFKNPLHPYTKSLLSAIPHPDPDYQFDKELLIYNPESEHYDYIFDSPEFLEVADNHFVLANKRELAMINKSLEK